MSRFNKFVNKSITKAQKWLPTVLVVYQGTTLTAISDSYSYVAETRTGGDVIRIGKELTLKTEEMPVTPEHGDPITVDGGTYWKINDLNAGATVTVLRVIDSRYHD